jgi:4-hydroxybenzoyl-CoA thioesterase
MEHTFKISQKVLFRHCDPAGIVFYPRYFEMLNDCVETFFDHIGYPFETMHPSLGVPTAEIEAAFKAPSRHGDHLEITLVVDRLGSSSLGLSFLSVCETELRFTAKSTIVYVNADGKPQKWTPDMRTALTPFLSEK